MSATSVKEQAMGGHEEILANLVRYAIDVTRGVTSVTEREGKQLIDQVSLPSPG